MDQRLHVPRASSAILAIAGFSVLLSALPFVVQALPELGGPDAPLASHAGERVLLGGVPLAVSGVLTLLVARACWLGQPRGRSWLLAWLVTAAIACGVALGAATNNVLSLLRVAVFGPGPIRVDGPQVTLWTANGFYDGRLDDPLFWLPGLVAVAAIPLALLLVRWRPEDRRQEPR